MEYSIDDGTTWQNYQDGVTFNTGQTVLVRIKETTNVLQSETITLNF